VDKKGDTHYSPYIQRIIDKHNKVYHNEFSYPHEEIIANKHPITMQSIGNIELIQEMSSHKYALELHINL
jgi:hypothetical protein